MVFMSIGDNHGASWLPVCIIYGASCFYCMEWIKMQLLSGRPAKLQKLHDLRRGVPYVSKSALEGILNTIQEKGLPEVRNTKAMLEATRQEISSWNAYGSLLQSCKVIDVHGAEKDLMFVNLHSLLHGLFKQGGSFTELLRSCHSRNESSAVNPYSLVIYTDECWPGNALSAKSNKKSWALYCSFKEFGGAVLSCEDAWLCLMFQKTSFIGKLDGSMSQALRRILVSFMHEALYCMCF